MESLLFLLVLAIGAGLVYLILAVQGKDQKLVLPLSNRVSELERELQRLTETKARLQSQLDVRTEELGETKESLKQARSERDELQGTLRTKTSENESLQHAIESLRKELGETKKLVTQFESEKGRREKELQDGLERLHRAEASLADERQRIRREDDARMEEDEENRARLWNDHELLVQSRIRECCGKPNIGLTCFDNAGLPKEFIKLKPDALVAFSEKSYVVFDAKKSKNIRTYIAEQAKSSAKKYQGYDSLHSTVFFVVPSDEYAELRQCSYVEDRFTFHVIPPEALEAVLALVKRLSEYEKLSEFDPQDRDAIVTLIASYDRHISLQNATNILLTKESVELMKSQERLDSELSAEIQEKKRSMRNKRLNETEIRRIANDVELQASTVDSIIRPSSPLETEAIEEVRMAIGTKENIPDPA